LEENSNIWEEDLTFGTDGDMDIDDPGAEASDSELDSPEERNECEVLTDLRFKKVTKYLRHCCRIHASLPSRGTTDLSKLKSGTLDFSIMTYILSQTEDGTSCPDDLELFIRSHYIEFRAKRVLLAEQQKLADSYLKKKGILPERDLPLSSIPPKEVLKKTSEDVQTTSDCGADFEGAPFDAFKLLAPVGTVGTTSSSSSNTIKVKIEEAQMLE
jgi:hypothetical protein